jgi:acyl-coenzyme A thioesterase PaaI-like protein
LKKVGRRVVYGDIDVFMDGAPDRLVAHATSSYILPDSVSE